MIGGGARGQQDAAAASGIAQAAADLLGEQSRGSTRCEQEATNRKPPGATSGAASRTSLR